MQAAKTNLIDEFARLGLTAEIIDTAAPGIVRVRVEGWPDAIWYDAAKAAKAIRHLPDDHAATEQGDAEMCRLIEDAGAYLGLGESPE